MGIARENALLEIVLSRILPLSSRARTGSHQSAPALGHLGDGN